MLNVDIPEDLKLRLEREAERAMRTQRAVLILALEAYLKDREQAFGASDTMSTDGTPDDSK